MKNVLFEQKKGKKWNKQHFVENATEIVHQIFKNTVNFLVAWMGKVKV
jgi:hypothetical protein